MYSKRSKKYLSHLFVALLVLNYFPATAISKPRTKCNIRVDDPHFSKSIEKKFGFRAVKVNARSKCNFAMSNLQLTVEIYKKGFFRNHFVTSETLIKRGPIPAEVPMRNNETWERCKNSRPTGYFGVAYATALIAGNRVNTRRVSTEKVVTLPCGT